MNSAEMNSDDEMEMDSVETTLLTTFSSHQHPQNPGNYDSEVGPTDDYLTALHAYYQLGDADTPVEADEPKFQLPMGDPVKFSYSELSDRFNRYKVQYSAKGWTQEAVSVVRSLAKRGFDDAVRILTDQVSHHASNKVLGVSNQMGEDLQREQLVGTVSSLVQKTATEMWDAYRNLGTPNRFYQLTNAIQQQREELKDHDLSLPEDRKKEIDRRDAQINRCIKDEQVGDMEKYWQERLFYTSFPTERKKLINLAPETEEALQKEIDRLLDDFDEKQAQDLRTIIYGIRNMSVMPDPQLIYPPSLSIIGSPGTGKSRFFDKLGKILGLPVVQLSLAGIKDSAELDRLLGSSDGIDKMTGLIAPPLAERMGEIPFKLATADYTNSLLYGEESVNALNDKDIGDRLKEPLDPTQKQLTTPGQVGPVKLDISCVNTFALGQTDLLDEGLRQRLPAKYFRALRPHARIKAAKKAFQDTIKSCASGHSNEVITKTKATVWKYLPLLIKANERTDSIRVLLRNINDFVNFVAGEYSQEKEIDYNQVKTAIENAYRKGIDDFGPEESRDPDLQTSLQTYVMENLVPALMPMVQHGIESGAVPNVEELQILTKRLMSDESRIDEHSLQRHLVETSNTLGRSLNNNNNASTSAIPMSGRPHSENPDDYDNEAGPTDDDLARLHTHYPLGDIDSEVESDEPKFQLLTDTPKFTFGDNLKRFEDYENKYKEKSLLSKARTVVTSIGSNTTGKVRDLIANQIGEKVVSAILPSSGEYGVALTRHAFVNKVASVFHDGITQIRKEYNKSEADNRSRLQQAIKAHREELKDHDLTLPEDRKKEIDTIDRHIDMLLKHEEDESLRVFRESDVEKSRKLWIKRLFFTSFPTERKQLTNLPPEIENSLQLAINSLLDEFDEIQRQDLSALISSIRNMSVTADPRSVYRPAASAIGIPGTGKSRFFDKLGKILGLPVIRLPLAGIHNGERLDRVIGKQNKGFDIFAQLHDKPLEEEVGKLTFELATADYTNAIVYAEEAVNALNKPDIGDRLKTFLDPAIKEIDIQARDGYIKLDISCINTFALGQTDLLDEGLRQRLPAKYFRALPPDARIRVAKREFKKALAAIGTVHNEEVMIRTKKTVWKYLPLLIKANKEHTDGIRLMVRNIQDLVTFVSGSYRDGRAIHYSHVKNAIDSTYCQRKRDTKSPDQNIQAQVEAFIAEKLVPELTKVIQDGIDNDGAIPNVEQLRVRIMRLMSGGPSIEEPVQQSSAAEPARQDKGKRKQTESDVEMDVETYIASQESTKFDFKGLNEVAGQAIYGVAHKVIGDHVFVAQGGRQKLTTVLYGSADQFGLDTDKLEALKDEMKKGEVMLKAHRITKILEMRPKGETNFRAINANVESSTKSKRRKR